MTATWRKQPPIPSRRGLNRPTERSANPHVCRRCRKTEIEDTMKVCWPCWRELSDLERDNLRTIHHPRRP